MCNFPHSNAGVLSTGQAAVFLNEADIFADLSTFQAMGLTSMEERAQELGGRLEIHSAPGAGTTVRFEVAV